MINFNDYVNMHSNFKNADVGKIEVVTELSPRLACLSLESRRAAFRKALTTLKLRKYVSVRTRNRAIYVLVDDCDTEHLTVEEYHELLEMEEDIRDVLEEVWKSLFPLYNIPFIAV